MKPTAIDYNLFWTKFVRQSEDVNAGDAIELSVAVTIRSSASEFLLHVRGTLPRRRFFINPVTAHGDTHASGGKGGGHGHPHFNLNMRAAFLHMLSDALGFVVVIISALAVLYTE